MGKRKVEIEVKPTDVTVTDAMGMPVKIGSIVEVLPWGPDRFEGLFWVVGFESGGGRGVRILLAELRHKKWDYKVSPLRVVLRSYEPMRYKGE